MAKLNPLDSILSLKRKIEQLKQETSRLEGEKNILLQQLNQVSGCSNMKAADKKLAQLEEETSELKQEVTGLVTAFQTKYEL